MATVAVNALGERINKGVAINKYWHAGGLLPDFIIYTVENPVPDENFHLATQMVIDLVIPIDKDDFLIFFISGGDAALFEKPLMPSN